MHCHNVNTHPRDREAGVKTLCNCVNTCIVKTTWLTENVVRFRGVKKCWNHLEITESLSGFRNRGVPVYWDFYTMKIEAEESGPSQLSGFEGIPVYWGSGFEGFHCTYIDVIWYLSSLTFECVISAYFQSHTNIYALVILIIQQ